VIAAKWGWQAAFGVVGVPGLVLALLYLKVRDYETVKLAPALDAKRQSLGEAILHIVKVLARSRTMLWVCIGGAAQLVVVSALWSWLPSFLNRVHGVAPAAAGVKAALVVLAGAAGAVLWGAVIDRAGIAQPRRRLHAMALLCLASMVVLVLAFGLDLAPAPQFALIAVGGFLATCTVGPVSAIVIDVIHPGVRATGSSVLALFQNLFGLAAGPFIAGVLSDAWGLVPALTTTPLFALAAAAAFLLAARSYASDKARAAEPLDPVAVPLDASAAVAPPLGDQRLPTA
jgi:predicted MFS family arabinose efflux permease